MGVLLNDEDDIWIKARELERMSLLVIKGKAEYTSHSIISEREGLSIETRKPAESRIYFRYK
jgi:hypothetical protein